MQNVAIRPQEPGTDAAAIARILQKEGVELLTCFPHNEIIDTVAALGTRPLCVARNGWPSTSPMGTPG